VSLLLWLGAPATGAAAGGSVVGTLSTIRYLLPGLAAAVVTLALATRVEGASRVFAAIALAAAVAVGVVQTHNLGFPAVPGPATPLLGAALGAAAAVAASRLARPDRLPGGVLAGMLAAALAALGLGGALAAAAPGYVARYARAHAPVYPYAGIAGWLDARPGFRDGSEPVAMVPIPNSSVVGDRLQHPLDLIPLREPCAAVRARLSRGWVVVDFLQAPGTFTAARCLAGKRPVFRGPGFRIYEPAVRP
jgi:hypothetical protein